MKILLIDDEQSLLDVFSQTFIAAGFEMDTALNGNDGLRKAKDADPKPDLVLLDQVLPDINGNQVLQILKQDPELKDIPVAMLSNFNQDNLVQEAINLGALDYILKYQIEPKDLVAKVNQLLKEHASKPGFRDEVPFNEAQKTQPPASTPPVTPTSHEPSIPTAPMEHATNATVAPVAATEPTHSPTSLPTEPIAHATPPPVISTPEPTPTPSVTAANVSPTPNPMPPAASATPTPVDHDFPSFTPMQPQTPLQSAEAPTQPEPLSTSVPTPQTENVTPSAQAPIMPDPNKEPTI